MIAKYLIEFLCELEELLDPGKNLHHSLTSVEFGSDEKGWTDHLCLQIFREGKHPQVFFLTDSDFEKSAKELARELRDLTVKPEMQEKFSIGSGRFV
jgi:hypothetical protein